MKVACSPLYLSSLRAACKTELDRPDPPCPACGRAIVDHQTRGALWCLDVLGGGRVTCQQDQSERLTEDL